jgi:signal transduction histidine kinase
MRPVWVNGLLVLARAVKIEGRQYLQGAWLDWDSIRQELLGEIRELLPAARLVPASPADAARPPSRIMAALPVRLMPGRPAGIPPPVRSPLRLPLAIAWACVLVAAAAFTALLVGAVSLSERRGAFVSAVTHELRTPLTTFQMYTEMLAEGMVVDAAQETDYLRTLQAEGTRLSHLVENVLAYARLERGRPRRHQEAVPVPALLERITERLSERVRRAGMEIVVKVAPAAGAVSVRTDLGVVEQIVFNLVDNACKYAAGGEDKRIHLEAERAGRWIVLRVRDHGPGIVREERGRMFRPFCKSARHAAESAPGVGLGLALSRRLARQVGGRLRLIDGADAGACFELRLPLAGHG